MSKVTRVNSVGPDDLQELPGVGRYTAAAIAAQADDADVIGIEVNIRRVCERVRGVRLSTTEAEYAAIAIAAPLRGRDRLLALMDLGATIDEHGVVTNPTTGERVQLP